MEYKEIISEISDYIGKNELGIDMLLLNIKDEYPMCKFSINNHRLNVMYEDKLRSFIITEK